MKKFKIIKLPLGVIRVEGHLRFNLFGLEFGLMWPTEEWSYGFMLAIFGHGLCLDKEAGFWLIHETLDDVWLTQTNLLLERK